MAVVPISKSFEVIIDDIDADWISQWKWTALVASDRLVYAYRRVSKSATLLMHRAIMAAAPDQLVDHINGNSLDNRRCNLRFCTKQQNQANSRHAVGSCGFRGVAINKSARNSVRYIAQISKIGYIGSYASAEEAARAYDAAAQEHYGEFAKLNFPVQP